MAQIQTEEVPSECDEIISRLSPYIDGELADEEAWRIESHLAGCTFCAAALEEMREASRSFRILIPVVPPIDIAQAVSRRVQELSGQGGEGAGGEQTGGEQAAADAWPPAGDTMVQPAVQLGPEPAAATSKAGGARKKIMFGVAVAAVALFGIGAWLLAEGGGGGGGEPPADSTVPAIIRTTTDKTTSRTVPAAVPDTSTQTEEEVVIPETPPSTPTVPDPQLESPAEPVPDEDPTAPGDQYGLAGPDPDPDVRIAPIPVRPVAPQIR